jgi:tRNA pseudouridine38-40 synthase
MALGVSYNGQGYNGWQSQLSGNTVQDKLEAALGRFATHAVSTLCAGRTDSGVHGLMQVVHFDTPCAAPMHRGFGAPTPFATRHCGAMGTAGA